MAEQVRYHLRAQITGDAGKAQAKKLWQIVERGLIDEVMFFAPHAEERSPGLGTLAECQAAAKRLAPLFAQCRKRGVTPSINIWWTMGFSNMPALLRDRRGSFRFRPAVGIDGAVSKACFCPLDDAWLAHIGQVYQTFARLKPARIWIDDDTRPVVKADLHSQCFCPVCLEEMTRRTGQKRSAPELVRAVLADPPNPVREQFIDFQRLQINRVVAAVRDAVAQVSPQTQVCLMEGPPEVHFTEGRKTQEMIQLLGGDRPYVRPNIGPYVEGSPVDVAESWATARSTAALFAGTKVRIAPEIENYPQSRFRKSAALVRLNMVMGQLLGAKEITLNVFPFTGRLDLQHESIWEERFAQVKPMLQALSDLEIQPQQHQGAALYLDEDVSRHVWGVAQATKPIYLYRQRPWDSCLSLLGFATKYGRGNPQVLTAEQVACFSGSALEELFAGGVLLDSRAAATLLRMGKGELAGLRARKDDAHACIESLDDKAFAALPGEPLSIRYNAIPWQFALARGARVVSTLRDYQSEVTGHGVVLFENKLGGRVAVYPYDSQATAYQIGGAPVSPYVSATFLTFGRQQQLQRVLQWLGGAPLPMHLPGTSGVCVLPVLIRQQKRTIAAALNAHADPVESLVLAIAQNQLPGKVQRVRALGPDGRWSKCKAKIRSANGEATIDTGLRLSPLDAAVLVIE